MRRGGEGVGRGADKRRDRDAEEASDQVSYLIKKN